MTYAVGKAVGADPSVPVLKVGAGARKGQTSADSAARFKEARRAKLAGQNGGRAEGPRAEKDAELRAEKKWKKASTDGTKRRGRKRNPEKAPAGELLMVEEATKLLEKKTGRGSFLTDSQVIKKLIATFRIDWGTGVEALKRAKGIVAERINTLMPTLGQNIIGELQDNVRAAQKAGDHATAGRCLIALGRFAGLDQPKPDPQQQVRQLSDAALEASIAAAVARKLEYMPQDQFEDLMRRREEARIRGAKLLAPDAPLLGMPKSDPIEADSTTTVSP